jgi:hypothetical protein
VSPNRDRIADGSYALARPGKLIVNQSALSRVEVMSFLWYALSDENLPVAADAGFVGLDFGDLSDARTSLQTAYAEATAAASQVEATSEPGVESTSEATAEATEASGD